MVPIELPRKYLRGELSAILYVEAAAAFDELTQSGMEKGPDNWKPYFQAGGFVSAGGYPRAHRAPRRLRGGMGRGGKKGAGRRRGPAPRVGELARPPQRAVA